MKKYVSVLSAIAIAALFMGPTVEANELLLNGGFESALEAPDQIPVGNFSPFSGGPAQPAISTIAPNSGASHLEATFNSQPNSFSGIQQRVLGIVGGEEYEFSLSARTDGNPFDLIAEFRIEWQDAAGVEVGRTGNGDFTGLNGASYTEFIHNESPLIAPTGATQGIAVFALQSFNGGTGNGTIFVDDISFSSVKTIPEPASTGLIALAMGAMAVRRRR